MKKIILAVMVVSATLLMGACANGPCSSCETSSCCGGYSFIGNWY